MPDKKLKYSEYANWAMQATNDAVKWAEINAIKHSKSEIDSYAIGYQSGYLMAIRDLAMHGYIITDIQS
jgi:hypothetical protein